MLILLIWGGGIENLVKPAYIILACSLTSKQTVGVTSSFLELLGAPKKVSVVFTLWNPPESIFCLELARIFCSYFNA